MDHAEGRHEDLSGKQAIARAPPAGAKHGARRERPALANHDQDEHREENDQRGNGPEQAWVVKKGVQVTRY